MMIDYMLLILLLLANPTTPQSSPPFVGSNYRLLFPPAIPVPTPPVVTYPSRYRSLGWSYRPSVLTFEEWCEREKNRRVPISQVDPRYLPLFRTQPVVHFNGHSHYSDLRSMLHRFDGLMLHRIIVGCARVPFDETTARSRYQDYRYFQSFRSERRGWISPGQQEIRPGSLRNLYHVLRPKPSAYAEKVKEATQAVSAGANDWNRALPENLISEDLRSLY